MSATGKSIINDSSLRNAHVGIMVFDPATNEVLYSFQADKFFVPASNTKIPTCFVSMKYLPDSLPSYFYDTRDDTIFIQPAGDPTFLHPEFMLQPSFGFLKNFKKISVADAGFSQFLGSGWSWNDYQEAYMAQRSLLPLYGNIARLKWNSGSSVSIQPSYFQDHLEVSGSDKGFDVEKSWDENNFILVSGNRKTANIPFRPDMKTIRGLLQDTLKLEVLSHAQGKRLPFTRYSQARDSMLRPMMHRSDNFYAEQSLLSASIFFTGRHSISSIIDTVLNTDFSDLPQKPRWVDGSGLSRYNLFTPAAMVSILGKMQKEFGMERIRAIFPAANQGTLTNYYKGFETRFFAKTGTLSGVVALSGYMYTNRNRMLIFSVLVNNHQSSAANVRRAVENYLKQVMEKN